MPHADFDHLSLAVRDTFGRSVTLTRRAEGAFDAVTGRQIVTEQAQTLNADRQMIADDEPSGGGAGGGATGENVLYHVRAADVTIGVPRRGDTVTDAGVRRVITAVSLEADGAMLRLRCRGESRPKTTA